MSEVEVERDLEIQDHTILVPKSKSRFFPSHCGAARTAGI